MQPQHRCRRREEEGGIKSESFAACDKQKPSKIRRRRRQISPPAAMAAQRDDEAGWSAEAARRVWGGAVPLQVHLHDADVTTSPTSALPGKASCFPIIICSFSACGYALHFNSRSPIQILDLCYGLLLDPEHSDSLDYWLPVWITIVLALRLLIAVLIRIPEFVGLCTILGGAFFDPVDLIGELMTCLFCSHIMCKEKSCCMIYSHCSPLFLPSATNASYTFEFVHTIYVKVDSLLIFPFM